MSAWIPPRLPIEIPGGGSVFIGRHDQLARFEQIWAAVLEGHRQVVFVGGEPGVGKTRLVAEISTTLHSHGATVLWGASTADVEIPYRPFVIAIERLLASAPAGAMAAVLGSSASQLLRLTPQIRRHRPDLGAHDGVDSDQRLALFDAVLDLLVALAQRGPVVVVLEDLHWATAPTRELMAHLVQSSARVRVLIIVTHRTTAPDRSDDFTYLMADLYRHDGVSRIDLGGLATEEVADYLAGEAGMPRAAALRSAAVLRDQTGGNPFFLRELWRDLAAEGGVDALRSARFRAPASVQDTLERRLAALPDAHADVVELAAVVGNAFDLAVLLEASDHARDVTLAAVDAGVGAGLFAIDPASSGRYHFLHALARQAVLDRLPPTRRVRHHISVAQALEGGQADGPEIVAQLAHHYDMGQALGHADDAVRYLTRAAEHAVGSLAHTDAARLFARAADISAGDGPAQRDLLFAAARNHIAAGDFAEARRLCEHLGKSEDPDTVLRAAICYEEASWRPGMEGQRAVELLEEALRRRDADPDDPVYIRGLASLGRALSFTGADRPAREVGERAIALARRAGDERLVAHALCGSLWRGMTPALAPVLLERAVELTELGRWHCNSDHLGSAAFFRAVFGYLRGLPGEWTAGQHDLARAVRSGGQPFYRYVDGCGVYARQFVRGDLAGAARTVAGLDALGADFGPHATDGSYGVQVFMLQRVSGELEQVRPLIRGTERTDDHWAPGLLALYTEFGMKAAARRV
ncbi:MAG TPA: AAA family ATPase, partial [Euzebyales bacterium]|nr:AAA family ATPase [Euzebyales bacterium]